MGEGLDSVELPDGITTDGPAWLVLIRSPLLAAVAFLGWCASPVRPTSLWLEVVWSVDGCPAVVLLESAGGGGRGPSHGSLTLGTGLRSSAVELVEWEVEGPSSSRITSEITLNPEKER